MRLSPCRLVRVPVGRCVSDVVGPGVKGIRVSPFLCLLCAVDPISHRHGAGTRDTGTIVVLYIIVSTVKTPEPEGNRPYLEWRSLWTLPRRSSPALCCKLLLSPLSTSWHDTLALCCLRGIILLGLLFFCCLLVLRVASRLRGWLRGASTSWAELPFFSTPHDFLRHHNWRRSARSRGALRYAGQ